MRRIIVSIDDGWVEVGDEEKTYYRFRFKNLEDDHIYYFFLGFLAHLYTLTEMVEKGRKRKAKT